MLLCKVSLAKASLHVHGKVNGQEKVPHGGVEGTAMSHGKVVLWTGCVPHP